jgi:hypothetical protein
MGGDLLSRSKYFHDFLERAQGKPSEEAFEVFIYQWLAMIIGMTDLLSYSGHSKYFRGDRELIEEFREKCSEDFNDLQDGFISEDLNVFKIYLANRKGSIRKHSILDASGEYGDYLAQLWKNNQHSSKELESFLIVACAIRNNLFHGKKSFMNNSDVELIKNVIPLINNINMSIVKLIH